MVLQEILEAIAYELNEGYRQILDDLINEQYKLLSPEDKQELIDTEFISADNFETDFTLLLEEIFSFDAKQLIRKIGY